MGSSPCNGNKPSRTSTSHPSNQWSRLERNNGLRVNSTSKTSLVTLENQSIPAEHRLNFLKEKYPADSCNKIHLPTFSEVGFRSWRRTFGVVRVKPWFDCKNRWTSQMGIEHLLLYLQNMLLFCCRIELPYEHWWATTLRESVHHTWHVILLSDSSMLANLVFFGWSRIMHATDSMGSFRFFVHVLWFCSVISEPGTSRNHFWRWGTLGRAYHWPTSCIGHVQLTGATMDANRDWEGLLEIWRFQTLSHCSLVVSRTGSENSWNESPVRLIIIAGWF